MGRISDHLDGLPNDAERRLERLFASFDSAWKTGTRPRISDYLPSGPPPERRAAMIELALVDLEYALNRDPATRIEVYLVEFPDLAADRDFVLELADREYRMRRERGSTPSLREYASRFPDLAARLILRFEDEDSAPRPDPFEADRTDSYHGKSPVPGSHRSGLTSIDPTVPIALPDDGQPRYRHIRAYARGGLGEVFVAEDSVLPRKVALKRIRPTLAGDDAVRSRFLREAEITARLEHPGVAPIYELIVDKSGQLWYVMRFLEGQTLKAAVDRYYKPKSSEDDAGRTLDFRRMLTRFVSACETMSYAHNLGVVHRDLTPANIMLGKNGETIVLDWGFATASGDPDAGVVAVSVGPVASPLDASLLKSGRLFGTPAFMSPEQAEMHQSKVGPLSDVYGLGAILYMVLTGRPPFKEADLATTLAKVISGDYVRPRELRPEVSPALEAICVKAMSLNPEARYPDAKDLGRDLERWLADEPVTAYRLSRSERLGRWATKHRRGLVLTAAAAVLAIVGASAYGIVAIKQNADTELAASEKRQRTTSDALIQKTKAEADARVKLAEARTLADKWRTEALKLREDQRNDPSPLEKAIHLGELAAEILRAADGARTLLDESTSLVAACRSLKADSEFVLALTEARHKGALNTGGVCDVQSKLDEYRRRFVAHGLDFKKLSDDEAAEKIRTNPFRARIVAILDDWAVEIDREADRNTRSKLFAIARVVDPDPLATKIRNAIEDRMPDALAKLADEVQNQEMTPTQRHTIGYALFKVGKFAKASEILSDEFVADYWISTTLARVHLQLASASFDVTGRTLHQKLAADSYRQALGKLGDSLWAYLNLHEALLLTGEKEEAIRVLVKAAKKAHKSPHFHYAQGFAYLQEDKIDEAAKQFAFALQIDPKFLQAHNGLVECRRRTKDGIGLAIDYYEARLKQSPRSAGYLCGRGLAFAQKNRFVEAEADLKSAIAIDPEFAAAHYHLGNVFWDTGRFAEAETAHARALEHGRYAPESPYFYHGLGKTLVRLGRFKEAEKALIEAIRLHPDFPEARGELGVCLLARHRVDDAVAELRHGRGRRRLTKAVETDETKARYAKLLDNLASLLAQPAKVVESDDAVILARLCRDSGLHAKSVAFWSIAFELDTPDHDAAFKDHFATANYLAAAKSALFAANGQDRDKPAPDDTERGDLRNQAQIWLMVQRDAYGNMISQGDRYSGPAALMLKRLQLDPDLACIRETPKLAKLAAGEAATWNDFWGEVDAMIAAAKSAPKSTGAVVNQ